MTAYNLVSLQQLKSPWAPGHVYKVGAYFDLSTTTGAAGLANGDVLTAMGLIPEGGAKVIEVVVVGSPADTNVAPTGAFSLGDSLVDANHAARYILAGTLAKTNGAEVLQYQNVTPTIVSNVYTKGVGYSYMTNENSNSEGGFVDIVLTVTAAMATAATSGVLYVYVTYICSGDM